MIGKPEVMIALPRNAVVSRGVANFVAVKKTTSLNLKGTFTLEGFASTG